MSSVVYCPNCRRNVGVEKKPNTVVGCAIPVACLILGLIVPLWPITLPLFWFTGGAFILIGRVLLAKQSCRLCGTPLAETEARRVGEDQD